MNEVIIYGGLPLRRADVYRDAFHKAGNNKAADMFAFGQNAKIAPERVIPFTLVEFYRFEEAEDNHMRIPRDIIDNHQDFFRQYKYILTANNERVKKFDNIF
jgi:hypothetical protein